MKRILFVDDEPSVLDGLRRSLRPQRAVWDMAFAASGRAALDVLAAAPCDVVVSDMRMPAMDGAALLSAVCAQHPSTVRIILSGYTDLEASIRAAPVAHRFLLKPCEPTALQQVIDQLLGVRSRLDSRPASELVGSLRAVPIAPETHRQLRVMGMQPRQSIDLLAAVMARDVGLAAKILQLANSAFFGRVREVADIHAAASYLGGSILGRLTAPGLENICYSFRPERPIAGFDIDAFQRHSVLTAAIAARLPASGRSLHLLIAAGLLHDIGKLVIADRDAHRMSRDDPAASPAGAPPLGLDGEPATRSHADIGAYLLGLWGLPEPIVEAVAHHHHPERSGPEFRDLAVATSLANWLAHAHYAVADGGRAGAVHDATTGGTAPDARMLEVLGGEGQMPAWRAMAAEVAAEVASSEPR